MTSTAVPALFGLAWADAVHEALDRGPDENVRAGKLPTYWEWIDNARARHDGAWALVAPDLPGHLMLEWEQGRCTRAAIVGPEEANAASYVLSAPLDVWRELLEGADAGRLVMYRRIRLERGDVLAFFRMIYFVVESIAAIGRIPARVDEATVIGVADSNVAPGGHWRSSSELPER